jgi:hypothetical protein
MRNILKILWIIVIIVFIISCNRTNHFLVYNSSENIKSDLFIITEKALNYQENRKLSELEKLIDVETFVQIYNSGQIDSNGNSDTMAIDPHVYFKSLYIISWSLQDDKGHIDDSEEDFLYLEIVDDKGYALTILNDVICFFNKLDDEWKIFYIWSRFDLDEISKTLDEEEVEKLVREKAEIINDYYKY